MKEFYGLNIKKKIGITGKNFISSASFAFPLYPLRLKETSANRKTHNHFNSGSHCFFTAKFAEEARRTQRKGHSVC